MGYSVGGLFKKYWQTIVLVRFSLITIAAMLALGFVTRYSGTDATLGLAFAYTGVLYPFFGTMLGWLGVALTGSDTASNVLFGGLAENHVRATRLEPGADGICQQFGGRNGQDDRCSEHRCREHRDALVRSRGRHPALRVLAQHRACCAGRRGGDAAGVCVAVHGDGGACRGGCRRHALTSFQGQQKTRRLAGFCFSANRESAY